MILGSALRFRPVRMLWLGQVGSTIGDELYKMAFLWLAVGKFGAFAGYLSTLQLCVVMAVSLVAGSRMDRYRSDRVLIGADLARAFFCMIPLFALGVGFDSGIALLFSALGLSAMSVFFDPVLHASIPLIAGGAGIQRAANNLMATTYRIGRVAGPALVSLLSGWIPFYGFFALDALSFVGSAAVIRSLSSEFESGFQRAGIRHHEMERGSWKDGFRLIFANPRVRRTVWVKGLGAGFWTIGYTLGLILLTRELDPGGLQSYGWVMGSYGAGNLLSALVFGSIHRKGVETWVFGGFLLIGFSFISMGGAHSIRMLCFLSALCAIAGPWNDTPFLELIQSSYSVPEQVRVHRSRALLDNASTLMMTLVAPWVFHSFGPRTGLVICGAGCVILALLGFLGGNGGIAPLENPEKRRIPF